MILAGYFFALHIGQVAQVVLPSAQQAMPQEDFAEESLWQQVLQPASSSEDAQGARANNLMSFI